jgi:hypothetical protein
MRDARQRLMLESVSATDHATDEAMHDTNDDYQHDNLFLPEHYSRISQFISLSRTGHV